HRRTRRDGLPAPLLHPHPAPLHRATRPDLPHPLVRRPHPPHRPHHPPARRRPVWRRPHRRLGPHPPRRHRRTHHGGQRTGLLRRLQPRQTSPPLANTSPPTTRPATRRPYHPHRAQLPHTVDIPPPPGHRYQSRAPNPPRTTNDIFRLRIDLRHYPHAA